MGPNLDVVIDGFIMLSLEMGKSALHVKHVKQTNKKTNPLTFECKCVFVSGGCITLTDVTTVNTFTF